MISSDDKKKFKLELKSLEENISKEIKSQVKFEFNYTVPIAEIEKAGISTTGGIIDNELKPLALEFNAYRVVNNLWTVHSPKIEYIVAEDNIFRTGLRDEPEAFYN